MAAILHIKPCLMAVLQINGGCIQDSAGTCVSKGGGGAGPGAILEGKTRE